MMGFNDGDIVIDLDGDAGIVRFIKSDFYVLYDRYNDGTIFDAILLTDENKNSFQLIKS